MHLDSACVGFEQDETGVTVRFANGREARGDLLIGADGKDSVVMGVLASLRAPLNADHGLGARSCEQSDRAS